MFQQARTLFKLCTKALSDTSSFKFLLRLFHLRNQKFFTQIWIWKGDFKFVAVSAISAFPKFFTDLLRLPGTKYVG